MSRLPKHTPHPDPIAQFIYAVMAIMIALAAGMVYFIRQ